MSTTRAHGFTRIVCAMCLALNVNAVTFAQTDNTAARKIDEFPDIAASDLIARLDNLAVMLQNEPNARAFLIVYRTRRDLPGINNKLAQRMRSYLVDSRRIEPERIVTVDGGVDSCLMQELWIVPFGATPQPRPYAYTDLYQPPTYKFDEFLYSLPTDDYDLSYWSVTPEMNLEAFAKTLQKNPTSTGYLIIYKSFEGNEHGFSQKMLRRDKNVLVKTFGIKPSRLRTIGGGFRERRTMELWIVQEGGYPPIITSYRLPRNRRKR